MERKLLLILPLLLASMIGRAQNDTLANMLSIGLNLMTHGEACGGGLPRTDDSDDFKESCSYFLLGRFRLNVDYKHKGLQTHAINGTPTSRLSCSTTYHYLAVATELDKLDDTLGYSVELEASYEFTKHISLTVGYTQMVGTETMMRLKQGNNSKRANWGWFSLVVSPSLFTAQW